MSKCLFLFLLARERSTLDNYLWPQFNESIFFFKLYIPHGKMVQYSGNNFLALVHNKKPLKVDIHIILQRYTL